MDRLAIVRQGPGRRLALAAAAGLCALSLSVLTARAEDDAAARVARWKDLQHSVFGERAVENGDDKIAIKAPDRAMDAALVPVTITVKNPDDVKGVYLLIDDNPAPLAAHVSFGPAADARTLELRVRVNDYTLMHAIEETKSGALYETAHFIKASGGCSAPAGAYSDADLALVGKMQMRIRKAPGTESTREVELLIRHPNFNGMQMDPATHGFTPAQFIKSTDVTFNGQQVVHLDTDISLSTDPAISFGLNNPGKGTLNITARDNDGKIYQRSFDVIQAGS